MKRLFLLLIILFCLLNLTTNSNVYAAGPDSNDLSSVEQMLFNQSYPDLSVSDRLNKIENVIYGQTSDKDSVDKRIKKIKDFVKYSGNSIEANQGNLPALNDNDKQNTPPERSFSKLEPLSNQNQQPPMNRPNVSQGAPPPDNNYPPIPDNNFSQGSPQDSNQQDDIGATGADSTSYPAIDSLEASLFGKTFAGESIYKRLDRLEIKLMGSKQKGSLYDRVNNVQIKSKYRVVQTPYNNQNSYNVPDNTMAMPPQGQSNYNIPNNNIAMPPQTQQKGKKTNKKSGKSDQPILSIKDDQISTLEQAVFNKTYSGDLSLNRLDRLEKRVFGQASFGSIDERINKIAAAVHGSPYNSTGTPSKGYYFTEDGYSKDDNSDSNEPRKQVMIGGSMGMKSDNSSSMNAPVQPPDDDLSEAEMNFFGKSYQSLDTETRLNRLENAIWGNVLGGDTDARIVRILQATKSINNAPGNTFAPQYGSNLDGGSNNSGSSNYSGGNSSTVTSRNLYNGYNNDSGSYGYGYDPGNSNETNSTSGFTTPGSTFSFTTPNNYGNNNYVNPNYGYNNTNPNYGYNNQNYGYNNVNPNYGYNNLNPNYGNNYNNYNAYTDPNQQYYNQPSTTRGIFSSVAGAALNSVLKNKNGVLGNMGRAAGNAIMGNPYGNYGYGSYGYGSNGYGSNGYGTNGYNNYPTMPYGIPY